MEFRQEQNKDRGPRRPFIYGAAVATSDAELLDSGISATDALLAFEDVVGPGRTDPYAGAYGIQLECECGRKVHATVEVWHAEAEEGAFGSLKDPKLVPYELSVALLRMCGPDCDRTNADLRAQAIRAAYERAA